MAVCRKENGEEKKENRDHEFGQILQPFANPTLPPRSSRDLLYLSLSLTSALSKTTEGGLRFPGVSLPPIPTQDPAIRASSMPAEGFGRRRRLRSQSRLAMDCSPTTTTPVFFAPGLHRVKPPFSPPSAVSSLPPKAPPPTHHGSKEKTSSRCTPRDLIQKTEAEVASTKQELHFRTGWPVPTRSPPLPG